LKFCVWELTKLLNIAPEVMISLILSTASKILLPVLLLFSFFVLIRGHYEPGGGFVGGLVAASAFALFAISNGVVEAKRLFPHAKLFIVLGLFFALFSGLLSVFFGQIAFTGLWSEFALPVIGKISTPLLFDIGVYFVVVGFATSTIFTLKMKE
jgi:multicomponent Na+:H+ antiporter subunit B